MESLHTRLDPIKEKVIKFTEYFGPFTAMREFGVADYGCFSKWLKEVTGDENYGLPPKISLDGGQGVAGQVAAKVVRMLLELQAENEALRKENKRLKLELSQTAATTTRERWPSWSYARDKGGEIDGKGKG